MTKLFQELNGKAKTPQAAPVQNGANWCKPVQNSFVRQAAQQGFRLTIPDFVRFAKMADGKDMQGLLQELRETGQMNTAQYDQLREQAQGFMGLLRKFM